MSQKIIFHLGAHRTGSTYIQKLFAKNRFLFEREDIFFEYFHEVKGLRKAVVYARSLARRGKHEAFKNAFQPVLNYLELTCSKPYKTIFLSYEGLLGELDLSSSRHIYPASRKILQEVNTVMKDKDITVVFCVRNYSDFIESTYKYIVRDGSSKNFEGYLEAIEFEKISWVPVIEALTDIFGKDKVVVWSFENFSANRGDIINWMFAQAGMSNHFLSELEFSQESANASSSQKALELMLEISPVITRYMQNKNKSKSKKLRKNTLKGKIYSLLKLSSPPPRTHMGPSQARKLKREINAILDDALPVAEFGKQKLLPDSVKLLLNKNYEQDLLILKELLADNARL